MTSELKAHIVGAYREIRGALFGWDWGQAEETFHAFCERHRQSIPDWYEDEFLFTGMKLWADDRQEQVLRHFALFFDRAAGETLCWSESDAAHLAALA